MTKAFTKGQQITLITVYGRNPADGMKIRARNAIVASCGEKRATIIDADTGAMIGRDFKPSTLTAPLDQVEGVESVRAVPGFDDLAAADIFAKAHYAAEVAGYDHRATLTQFEDSYTKDMAEKAAQYRANGFTVVR